MQDQIQKINEVVKQYFVTHRNFNQVPATKLMPQLIEAGIFKKNVGDGLPIIELLTLLEKSGALQMLPNAFSEVIDKKNNWYFRK